MKALHQTALVSAVGALVLSATGALGKAPDARYEAPNAAIDALRGEVARLCVLATQQMPSPERRWDPERLAKQLDRLQERLHRLEVLRIPSTLHATNVSDDKAPAITAIGQVFLIQHYSDLVHSLDLCTVEHARALLELSQLPEPELHFSPSIEQSWLHHALTTSSEDELWLLARAYRGMAGSGEVGFVLMDMARYSPYETVRQSAVNALRHHTADPLVIALAEEAAAKDPAASVRRAAQELLEKEGRR